MEEQLVGFEVAKLAKEKQFYDENVYGEVRLSQPNYYDNLGVIHDIREAFDPKDYDLKDCVNAPTQSLLQKWLREVHKIHVDIKEWELTNWYFYIKDGRTSPVKNIRIKIDDDTKWEFDSYEEALEVGLLEGLKLI